MIAQAELMLETIQRETIETASVTGVEELPEAVYQALLEIPRNRFVPEGYTAHAYTNQPLPIGRGQTISQPFIVALMSALLGLSRGARVLEIGTGSGYQAAVLARLAEKVYTTEIIDHLADEAQQRLASMGLMNVMTFHRDGFYGLPEQAPFDGIIVTAAATEVPAPLIEQLAPGAALVIPIGRPNDTQQLYRIVRQEGGELSREAILAVRFVPLTRLPH